MSGSVNGGDGAGDGAGDGPRDEAAARRAGYRSVGWALARLLGGLALIALGLFVSVGVVTAVIGVPMMVAGYALYRSSPLSGRRERGVRMDYREE